MPSTAENSPTEPPPGSPWKDRAASAFAGFRPGSMIFQSDSFQLTGEKTPSSRRAKEIREVTIRQEAARAEIAAAGRRAGPASDGYTVVYLPGLEEMALGVAKHLGDATPVLCTSSATGGFGSGSVAVDATALAWEAFPSGDPDLKLRVSAMKDRHVVLLMNHDTTHLFEQLAVILFLQRFNVPHPLPAYARGKWKKTMAHGKYDECAVASLTIIVPWYRHCQMERTSRWTWRDGKWYNGSPDGEFVDVPTAQSFAAMLSALPIPGDSPPPPQQLLLIDIHEYDDLEKTLDSTHRWANERRPYDHVHGTGTYFASGFDRFLSNVLLSRIVAPAKAFVVFPDGGAHRRFCTMVHTCVPGIPYENILWIDKTRVGASVTQSEGFSYSDAAGGAHARTAGFPADAFVLLADDFTNSGSTLFGGAEIIRRAAADPEAIRVCAYVSHFVAKYDRATVTKFVSKLYDANNPLDEFHCTDSIPNVIAWLREDIDERVAAGRTNKVHVMPLAPLIGDWIVANNTKHQMPKTRLVSRRLSTLTETAEPRAAAAAAGAGRAWLLLVAAAGVGLGVALGRRSR